MPPVTCEGAKLKLELRGKCSIPGAMFSHVVVFWTDPGVPDAADQLIAGAHRFLAPIPGTTFFHIGKMIGSSRLVVDQSYQVALNSVFPSQVEREAYRRHPMHTRFEEEVLNKYCLRRLIYDFA